MSRGFSESCRGACWKPLRGWLQGKMRNRVESLRHRLRKLHDEDDSLIMPRIVNRNYMGEFDGKRWREPNHGCEVILRNGRKVLLIHEDCR